MDSLYGRDGELFVPSDYTRGPWNHDHQHAGPPSALLLRALEGASRIEEGQTVRTTFDILRPVPVAPMRVEARLLRPGRNVEQLEATLVSAEDGTELMRARAWRMRSLPQELPDALDGISPGPAPPEDVERRATGPTSSDPRPPTPTRSSGASCAATGTRAGLAVAWTRMKVGLVEGEPITPLQHLLVVGDAASGISAALDWKTWMFINVDFSVALERPPSGEWIAMDAVTRFGTHGAATAHCEFADRDGRVGTSTQAILVGPR